MTVVCFGVVVVEMGRYGCIWYVFLVELLGFSDELDGMNGELWRMIFRVLV